MNNDMKQIFGISFNPKSQAKVESLNKILGRAIRDGFVRHDNFNWVNHLQEYVNSWNNVKNKSGYSPNYLYEIPRQQPYTQEHDKAVTQVMERRKKEVKKQIAKNDTKELQVGQWVRISMYQMDSSVREAVKSGNKKDIVVRYTPRKYRIIRVYRPSVERAGLQMFEYELEDENGHPLTNARGNN